MKYIFVVNRTAGSGDPLQRLKKELEKSPSFDYDIYLTKGERDATHFVKDYCEKFSDECCFVACGGDGTLNEVVSGLVGQENKYFSLLAFGSGNDFAKYYPDRTFTSVSDLLCGQVVPIDVLKINESYAVNMVNIGLEANVGAYANKVKIKGGKHAYTKGLVHAIFTGRFNKLHIEVDGKEITSGTTLLCSVANGKYAGSKYKCAPLSMNDDGYLDVCLFKSMSLLKFLTCVKSYERGEHLIVKKTEKKRVYVRGSEVRVFSKKQIGLCLDGEMIFGKEFTISVLHHKLNFILHRGEAQ